MVKTADEPIVSRSRGVLLVAVSYGVTAVGSTVTMILLARALTTEARGLVAAVVAPALLIAAVFPTALVDAVTYFCARQPDQAARIFRRALLLGEGLTLLGVCGTWVLAPVLMQQYPVAQEMMVLISWTALLGSVTVLLRARANAARRWGLLPLESLIANSLRPILLLLLWAYSGLTVSSAAWVLALAPAAGMVVYLPLRSRSVPAAGATDAIQSVRGGPSPSYRQILSYGLGGLVGVIGATSLGFFDQLLMTPFAGAEQLAYYAVAMGVANLVGLVAVSIRSVVLATEAAVTDWRRISESSRLSLSVTVVLAVLVALASPVLIPAIFGRAYAEAVVPLLILLVSTAALSPGTVVTAGLAAAGRPHLRAVAVGVGASVNVALVVWLVPALGAIGAALAMLATSVISVLAILLTRRLHSISLSAFVVPRRGDIRVLLAASRSAVGWRHAR